MDYMNQSLQFSSSRMRNVDDANLSQIPMELDIHRIFVKKEEPLKRELEAFIRAAEMSVPAQVDGWDALANLRVCNGALRSLVNGRQVEVSESMTFKESSSPLA